MKKDTFEKILEDAEEKISISLPPEIQNVFELYLCLKSLGADHPRTNDVICDLIRSI